MSDEDENGGVPSVLADRWHPKWQISRPAARNSFARRENCMLARGFAEFIFLTRSHGMHTAVTIASRQMWVFF